MDIRSQLAQGRNLLQARKYEAAVRVLQSAVRRQPDFPDVHNQLGVALSLAGEALRAESHLQRAVELNPEYAEAQLNLSILLFERGAYSAARDHLRAFDRVVRGSGEGFPDPALDDLAGRHAALGERYRAYGMLPEAEEQLRTALRLRPGYCDLRLRLARLFFERSKLVEAAEQVEMLLQQRPQYEDAHLLHGRIEQARGNPAAARAAWLRVRQGPAAAQARAFLETLEDGEPGARWDPTRGQAAGGER